MKKSERPVTGSVDYLGILSQCEKVAKVHALELSDEDRLDTGLLCLNGILGGGLTAGMYTFFGPEQSAKTTAAITVAGASVNQDVGLRMLWDAENSTGSSTDYVENIFTRQNVKAKVETIFGVKKDGKYVVKPIVYYRDEGEAETFFNFVSALLRRLPAKRFEDKQWWVIYPNSKENLAKFSGVMDPEMSKLNDAIYIKAESGALQAIIIIDSYPGLVPESMDDDDPSNAIAQPARELSKGIQRVKGKLRSRRVALVGINQLRTNPMARFCFHYNARVVMADGRQEKIGDIVTKRIEEDVLSYNPNTKEFEAKPITAWYDNGPADEWLNFTAVGGATANGQTRFTCTPEHELVLVNGAKARAGKVRVGDYLLGSSFKRSCGEVAKQIILGSVLGDGWFTRNEYPGIRVNFAHKLEHIEYVMYKHHYTDGSLYSNSNVATCEPAKNYEMWLERIYRETRAEHVGTRRYNFSPTLAQMIDLRGIAIWWMDDGGGTSIKTQSLGLDNTKKLIAALNSRLGLSLEISAWKDAGEPQCGVKFAEADVARIAPYIHPIFSYRLTRFVNSDWFSTLGSALDVEDKEGEVFRVPLLVTSIERTPVEVFPNRNGQAISKWKRKYDIEVAENHLYVLNGAVVSNSNPEYEPGGGAIKFFSDARLRFYPRALSSVPFHPKGEGQYEKEAGVDGGVDVYRYINVRAIKNKLSLPNRETWLRVWVEDAHGQAQGYDPVWDVFYALHLSGQIEGKRSALRLKPHGREPFKKVLTWLQFKQAIIGSKDQKQEVFEYLGMKKAVDLRGFVLNQMRKGVYEDLYVATQQSSTKKDKEEEEK